MLSKLNLEMEITHISYTLLEYLILKCEKSMNYSNK